MQITLKQRDIEQALKQFIASQGINLANKTVGITFTAGRREAGLSADIVIDPAAQNQAIPFPEANAVLAPIVAQSAAATETPAAASAEATPATEAKPLDASAVEHEAPAEASGDVAQAPEAEAESAPAEAGTVKSLFS